MIQKGLIFLTKLGIFSRKEISNFLGKSQDFQLSSTDGDQGTKSPIQNMKIRKSAKIRENRRKKILKT